MSSPKYSSSPVSPKNVRPKSKSEPLPVAYPTPVKREPVSAASPSAVKREPLISPHFASNARPNVRSPSVVKREPFSSRQLPSVKEQPLPVPLSPHTPPPCSPPSSPPLSPPSPPSPPSPSPPSPPPPELSEEAIEARDRLARKLDQINTAISAWTPTIPQSLPQNYYDSAAKGAKDEKKLAQKSSASSTRAGTTEKGASASTSADVPSSPQEQAPPQLDADQAAAIAAARAGQSFFLTGSAGTGKSFVLRHIIRDLRRRGRTVAVTASTGCAAVALHGSTIHSLSGVGLGLDSKKDLRKRAQGRQIARRLSTIDTLIIDEVSMIDSLLFDKIELMFSVGRQAGRTIHASSIQRPGAVLRRRGSSVVSVGDDGGGGSSGRQRSGGSVNRNGAEVYEGGPPFGGVQVIVCGDFFQLPPVAPSDNSLKYSKEKFFAFEAEAWKRCIQRTFVLGKVHRQTDGCFVALLNEIRLGTVSDATCKALQACFVPKRSGVNCTEADETGRFLSYTKLFSYRWQVEKENEIQLGALQTPAVLYRFRDWSDKAMFGVLSANAVLKLLDSTNALPEVVLKQGARVLCLKNLDVENGICNGSAGVVIGFALRGEERLKLRKKREGITESELLNIEGLLADEIRDLSDEIFAKLLAETQRDPGTGAYVLDCEESKILPVVEFDNGQKKVMSPANWEVYNMSGQVCAARSQVPLTLGWALSIHKSQGMTLRLVETDLAKAFDFGQVYVALSRATSMQGLRLTSFRADAVRTHGKVCKFYEQLNAGTGRKKKEEREEVEEEDADMDEMMVQAVMQVEREQAAKKKAAEAGEREPDTRREREMSPGRFDELKLKRRRITSEAECSERYFF